MNAFARKRLQTNLNQEQVAEKLQIDRSTVCKWETGKAYPRSSMLPLIAKLYHCTIDELLFGDEPDRAV